MLFDADVYDLEFNHECHEFLLVGEGGACGDFLTQTARHISRSMRLVLAASDRSWNSDLTQRSPKEVWSGSFNFTCLNVGGRFKF